jgi:hypothetical protein
LNNDGLIKQAVIRLVEVSLRQGFTVSSKDEKIDNYIKKRIHEIEIASGKSFLLIVDSIFTDLCKYGNAFLVFSRLEGNSMGKPYKHIANPKKEMIPISSMQTLNPLNMKIYVNKKGIVTRYRHDPSPSTFNIASIQKEDEVIFNETRMDKNGVTDFSPMDIIHFKYDGENSVFGRPFFIEALDDLIMLRKTEEQIDNMLANGMFNAVIYNVGNKDFPPKMEDMEKVQETLEWEPAHGVIVIPGHHKVEYLQSQNITQLIELMNYFKNRFFSGIGMSSVSMGESGSSNRATAETTIVSLYEKANRFQNIVSMYFRNFFEHIIYDMGKDITRVGYEQFPIIKFPEPDVNLKIKKENHAIYKYEHSAITEDEMREEIDMSPVADEKGMYIHKVKMPLIKNKEREEIPTNENQSKESNEEQDE